MSLRLSKRINIGKFLRLNISGSGVGVSVGVPGARVTAGPSGKRLTLNVPGTGISYVKNLDGPKKKKAATRASRAKATQPEPEAVEAASVATPSIPAPGPFAPAHELAFAQGLADYQAGKEEEALSHFVAAAPSESGAAILAAAILLEQNRTPGLAQAESLLESVLERNESFPTPLVEKYLPEMALQVNITPRVKAQVAVGALAATLLLAEVYQARNRLDEAMDMLEGVQDVLAQPALTLSLCELYGLREIWDGIVERAGQTAVTDDVTFETMLWYGRAMQGKDLHEAALTVFAELLKKKKDRNSDLLTEAMYWRAVSYAALGKQSQANREFQKVYARSPGFRDVAQRIG
jgi:tetratricopeptide (TPR) repeat protein